MFDVIERLKAEWTDRYVVVNSPAPELARFANATGTVKTVNMNGRCLVQFDQFNNVGWYDIDPAALKIVTEPRPKPVETEATKPAAAKPAASKPAAAKPAAKPAAGKPASGKPSTADILAAARGKAAAAPTGQSAEQKAAGGKPSTAEILARARAAKGAAPPQPAEEPSASEDEAPAEPQSKPAGPKSAGPKSAGKPAAGGALPTTTAEKVAWCRQHDAKS